MTEYQQNELRNNLVTGTFEVASAASNGLDIEIPLVPRSNSSYKVKLTLEINNSTSTTAFALWCQEKTTSGFTAQARIVTGLGISGSLGAAFKVHYEVWE